MSDKWWEKHCPVCDDTKTVTTQEDTIRYCRACEFQWSMESPEWTIIVAARDHIRKGTDS